MQLIAPSFKGFENSTRPMKAYIESLGLVAKMSEDIYNYHEPIYSNTDEYRANDLISAIMDDNVKIIWAIRGGIGCIRLIPILEKRLPATLNSKILIGFSDITVLHLYFISKYGWQTFNAYAIEDVAFKVFDMQSESFKLLEHFIFERQDKFCLSATKLDENGSVNKIESKVTGGTLNVVESSLGTVWEVNAKGKILFLEDLDEGPSSIEGSLEHMRQYGVFNHVDAVVFGDFTDCRNDTLMDFIIQRFALSVSFPVFRVTGIGHGNIFYPLPLNTFTEINRIDTKYEFCVHNIQTVTFSSSISRTCSSNALKGLTICILFRWLLF